MARRNPARILELPAEILNHILASLSFSQVCSLSAACKLLYEIEAEHQEKLWYDLAHLRWVDPHRDLLYRFKPPRNDAVGAASWKQKFFCLYAREHSKTTKRISKWLENSFEFTLELVSADGERVMSDEDGGFLFPRKRKDKSIWFQIHFDDHATNFFPAAVELHATRKADGRKVRLLQADVPPLDTLSPSEAATRWHTVKARVLPAWAEEPMDLDVTLSRKQGWARTTRDKPQARFDWRGAEGRITGGSERFWKNYSLVGNLFVALRSDRVFTDPSMTACDQR